jgi:hypothetical protein
MPAPVFPIHDQVDTDIPVRRSRLIHAKNPATELWETPGSYHCGVIRIAPTEFQQRLLSFFELHSKPDSSRALRH